MPTQELLPSSQRLPKRLLALACLLLHACGAGAGPLPPAWIDVSQGYQPGDNLLVESKRQGDCTLEHVEGIAQFRFDLSSADWSFRQKLGVQRTILGLLGYPDDRMDLSALWIDGKQLVNQSERGTDAELLQAGEYALLGGTVYLGAEPSAALPTRAELCYAPRRGRREGNAWAITGRCYSGNGLSIWSGEQVTRVLSWAPGARLQFATSAELLQHQPSTTGNLQCSFRIHHGQDLIFEYELEVPREGAASWHSIELPQQDASRPGEQGLRFSVSGDMAYTSFMAPVISNRPLQQPKQAAAQGGRSNVIVLQMDTFRADTLKPYGGQLELAPNLESLMRESLVFQKAWSVGSYTLPAHASMLSGLYPRQAGIENDKSRMPRDVVSLAEFLGEAGYRTGAIVDSGFVSQLFGMHQGFQWFDEHNAGFQSTLQRIKGFLDADDGRPTFLFVQSFAVHSPYDISQATSDHFGESLKLDRSYSELMEFVEANGFDPDIWKNGKELQEALSEEGKRNFAILVEHMRDLYFANIFEFDVQFTGLRTALEARGFFEPGQMIFLSDHGESFLNHHALFHGNILYEAELRVPFFIYGSGIEPGLSSMPISVVDLAPTVAELCGLEPLSLWVGHSVLGAIEPRTLYAFQCSKKKISTWAQIEGDRKWIGLEPESMDSPEQPYAAFDLGEDPHETKDLAQQAAWVKEFNRNAALIRESLFTPLFGKEKSEDSLEMDAAMRALGYMGDDE